MVFGPSAQIGVYNFKLPCATETVVERQPYLPLWLKRRSTLPPNPHYLSFTPFYLVRQKAIVYNK